MLVKQHFIGSLFNNLVKNKDMKAILMLLTLVTSCNAKEKEIQEFKEPIQMNVENNMEVATFAGGCFWCTEAIFNDLKGVKRVVSGYTGGTIKNPSYREICTGTTGHAEAIQITFDPNEIAFEDLLEVFFGTHDPTTLNRQGADVGTQYRSEIFYHSLEQKEKAEAYIQFIEKEKLYSNPIVTNVSSAVIFYTAEENHQDYLDLIVGEMLPKINAENLADYVDAFCETNYFSVEETEFVIKEALKFGLKPKVHVNQFTSIGGIQKCVKLNAVSVDHLEIMEENNFLSSIINFLSLLLSLLSTKLSCSNYAAP